MSCCGSKNKRIALQQDEIRKAMNNTRFSQKEVTELRQRFYRMSNGTGRLRKEQFREHMGVLGMDTVFFLSDRIFSMLDTDGDGNITFHDFIHYFDIITNGTHEQKSKMAFSYIDTKNKGCFELSDLTIMINGIINSWSAVTGSHLNGELVRRVDFYIKHIFAQMDIRGTGKVTFDEYSEAINKNPNILEIFEFLNKGISETIKDEEEQNKVIEFEKRKDAELTKKLLELENQLDFVISMLSEEPNAMNKPQNQQIQQQQQQPHQQLQLQSPFTQHESSQTSLPVKFVNFKRSSNQLISQPHSENEINDDMTPKSFHFMSSIPIFQKYQEDLSPLEVPGQRSLNNNNNPEQDTSENASLSVNLHVPQRLKINFRTPFRTQTTPSENPSSYLSKLIVIPANQIREESPLLNNNNLSQSNEFEFLHQNKGIKENSSENKIESKQIDQQEPEEKEIGIPTLFLQSSFGAIAKGSQKLNGTASFFHNPTTNSQVANSLNIEGMQRTGLLPSQELLNLAQKDSQIQGSADIHQSGTQKLLHEDSNIKRRKVLSLDRGFEQVGDESQREATTLDLKNLYNSKAQSRKSSSMPFDIEQGSFNGEHVLAQKESELKYNQGSETTTAPHFMNNQFNTSSIISEKKGEEQQDSLNPFHQIPKDQSNQGAATDRSGMQFGQSQGLLVTSSANSERKYPLTDQNDSFAPRQQGKSSSVSQLLKSTTNFGMELQLKLSMTKLIQNVQDDTNKNDALANNSFSSEDSNPSLEDESNNGDANENNLTSSINNLYAQNFQSASQFSYHPNSKSNVTRKSKYSFSSKSNDLQVSSTLPQPLNQQANKSKYDPSQEPPHSQQQQHYQSPEQSSLTQQTQQTPTYTQNKNVDQETPNETIIQLHKLVKTKNQNFNMKMNSTCSVQLENNRKKSDSVKSQDNWKVSRSENLGDHHVHNTNQQDQSSSESLSQNAMANPNAAYFATDNKSKRKGVQEHSKHDGTNQDAGSAAGSRKGSQGAHSNPFINIQNSKILTTNEYVLEKSEQNIKHQTNNNLFNINISNNYFISHPHDSASMSPQRSHKRQKLSARSKNFSTSQPTTDHNMKCLDVPPSKYQHQTRSCQTIENNNGGSDKSIPNDNAMDSRVNYFQQDNNTPIHSLGIAVNSGGGGILTRSNSMVSQGSGIFSQGQKSGFFKEHKSKSIISPVLPFLHDTSLKKFIKSINGMSNEQLKERVLTLYSKVFDIKEQIKQVRREFNDKGNSDDVHDPSIATATEKNSNSMVFINRPSRNNSSRALSPQNPVSHPPFRHSSHTIPHGVPPIQAVQDMEFRSMRASTAINVPKRTAQKTLLAAKKKTMVFFGHQNWNLVLNMMMGVQMAIRSVSNMGLEVSQLDPQDYKLKYYFELLPRRRVGEQSTFKICKFSDYAPQVFRQIRQQFGISSDQYLKSIGPDTLFSSMMRGDLTTLSELTSTGKSGSFFYYTVDGRFTLKTIKKSEFTFLKQILESYHKHLKNNPNTLIIKFFGLHKIKYRLRNSVLYKYIYFIIMSNVFNTRKEIHERFDLKGSLFKRFSNDPDPSVAKKDLNFINQQMKLQVHSNQYTAFMEVVRKDCLFFEQNSIIDYSLLVGLNYSRRDRRTSNITDDFQNQNDQFDDEEGISHMKNRGGDISYHFGVIDILTLFASKKKFEYLVKRVAFGSGISTVPPQQYAQRFLSFVDNCFDDTSKSNQIGQILNRTIVQSSHLLVQATPQTPNPAAQATAAMFSNTNLLQNQSHPPFHSLTHLNLNPITPKSNNIC